MFPCGEIMLEGCWHLPEASGAFPAVVVCHPHPLHGGSMSANVVFSICEALARRSITALRFNFRGVGKSGGTFGDGIAEQDDVRAALELISSTPNIDLARLGLAGYSFGGRVVLAVANQDSRIKLLALVAPALFEADSEQLKAYSRPVFLIIGGNDNMIPPELVRKHLADTAGPRQGEIIPGPDHFWQGYEAQLAEKVAEFFASGFQGNQ